jgi:hypothetical protein
MAKQFISGQEVKESKVEAIIFTGIPTLTKKHPTSLHPLCSLFQMVKIETEHFRN